MCQGPAPVDPGNSKGELRPWHSCIPGLNDQYDEEELAKKVKKECTTKEEKNQESYREVQVNKKFLKKKGQGSHLYPILLID